MCQFIRLLSVFILSLAFAGPGMAGARPSVPIENIQNAPLIPKAASLEAVQAALERAAKRRGWVITTSEPGKAVGTLVIRGKHTVVVDIAYTTEAVSLSYKNSINMNFETYTTPPDSLVGSSAYQPDSRVDRKYTEGQPLIHPNYNVWVKELFNQLNSELASRP